MAVVVRGQKRHRRLVRTRVLAGSHRRVPLRLLSCRNDFRNGCDGVKRRHLLVNSGVTSLVKP